MACGGRSATRGFKSLTCCMHSRSNVLKTYRHVYFASGFLWSALWQLCGYILQLPCRIQNKQVSRLRASQGKPATLTSCAPFQACLLPELTPYPGCVFQVRLLTELMTLQVRACSIQAHSCPQRADWQARVATSPIAGPSKTCCL
jgi:hypothetical protein